MTSTSESPLQNKCRHLVWKSVYRKTRFFSYRDEPPGERCSRSTAVAAGARLQREYPKIRDSTHGCPVDSGRSPAHRVAVASPREHGLASAAGRHPPCESHKYLRHQHRWMSGCQQTPEPDEKVLVFRSQPRPETTDSHVCHCVIPGIWPDARYLFARRRESPFATIDGATIRCAMIHGATNREGHKWPTRFRTTAPMRCRTGWWTIFWNGFAAEKIPRSPNMPGDFQTSKA